MRTEMNNVKLEVKEPSGKTRRHTVSLLMGMEIVDDFTHPIQGKVSGVEGENTTPVHVI